MATATRLAPMVAVAYSGGRDSTALLHVTLRQARALGLQVVALHVHHNLQPEADAWLHRARARCARWAREGWPLRFDARQVAGVPGPAESIEAWARRERYAALAEMARDAGASLVLLAHHRRDQAETFLLQALRGGGAAALSAMPEVAQRQGIAWARPWLQQPREAIETYLQRHRLQAVDDPSNADARYARSRLRQQVWPALQAAFWDVEQCLAAAAARAQQERACLDELAQMDTAAVCEGEALRIERWLQLSVPRRALVLRAWVGARCGRGPAESLVQRLVDEVPFGDRPATWPAGDGQVQRYRGLLTWQPAPSSVLPEGVMPLSIDGPGRHELGRWGVLHVRAVSEGGVPFALLRALQLRPRTGGEQFQSHARGMPRGLKKQFQAAALPAWQRQGPLVFAGDQLVYVPGLGLDARVVAPPGVPQATLDWEAPKPPGAR